MRVLLLYLEHATFDHYAYSNTSPFFLFSQVKIQGQNEEMLAAACQQFLGKTEAEIRRIALETLEGHQRAIMGK